jgi:hypothetical protein
MKQLKKSSENSTEENRSEASCLSLWVLSSEIKNEKGERIEFDRHAFMMDIYDDPSQVIAVRKPSQVGASTWAILKEIHSMKFLGINQIHTLPSDRDVWGFVPTKVDKIIKANGFKMEKDSAEIKGFGKGFCYYKGTFTEKAPIIISSDRNIYDEVDKSKMEVIGDYASRMSNSELKEEIWISTPTIPDFGIDAIWQSSDQKHWRFDCPHCGYRQHMEWDTNINFEKEIYVCQQCRKEITNEDILWADNAGWEARFPDEPISGYWISQMMCWDAKHVIKEYRESIQGLKGKDEQYFFNFILGMPHLSAEQKIEASLFYQNIVPAEDAMAEEWNVMGADTGDENHIIIGNEKGIFWMGVLRDKPGKTRWQQMEEMIEFYKVRVGVVDALPHTKEANALAEKFPYRIYLNFFKDDPKMLEVCRFGDEQKRKDAEFTDEIKVLTSRNRIYDDTIASLQHGITKFAMPKDSPTFKLMIKHAQTVYARKVTDRYGQERREWANIGADHFWTALIYWQVALKKRLKYEPNK